MLMVPFGGSRPMTSTPTTRETGPISFILNRRPIVSLKSVTSPKTIRDNSIVYVYSNEQICFFPFVSEKYGHELVFNCISLMLLRTLYFIFCTRRDASAFS